MTLASTHIEPPGWIAPPPPTYITSVLLSIVGVPVPVCNPGPLCGHGRAAGPQWRFTLHLVSPRDIDTERVGGATAPGPLGRREGPGYKVGRIFGRSVWGGRVTSSFLAPRHMATWLCHW